MRIPTFLSLLVAGLMHVSPAHAVDEDPSRIEPTTVVVQGPDSVVRIDAGSCSTPIRYSVDPGLLPEGGSYDVTARLRDDAGGSFGSDSTWIDGDERYRGGITPRCGKGLVSGRYSIAVVVVVNDDSVSRVERREGSTTVRLTVRRPAPTRLVVTKSAYGSAGWQWTGRLTSNGRPVAGQRINLWWDFSGWDDYGVSKRTGRAGIAHWVSNPDGALAGVRFQLRFGGATGLAPSRSAIFDIAPR